MFGDFEGAWVLGCVLGLGFFLVALLDSGLLFDAKLSIEAVLLTVQKYATVYLTFKSQLILKSEYLSKKASSVNGFIRFSETLLP